MKLTVTRTLVGAETLWSMEFERVVGYTNREREAKEAGERGVYEGALEAIVHAPDNAAEIAREVLGR